LFELKVCKVKVQPEVYEISEKFVPFRSRRIPSAGFSDLAIRVEQGSSNPFLSYTYSYIFPFKKNQEHFCVLVKLWKTPECKNEIFAKDREIGK